MAKKWYIADNDEKKGPFDRRLLAEMASIGELHGGTVVWREGMEGWAEASAVPELACILPGRRAKRRKPVIAYVLLFVLGLYGGHQFYLGKMWKGIIFLTATTAMFIVTFSFAFGAAQDFNAAFLLAYLPATALWVFDLATLSRQVDKVNRLG